ncbi:MAG: ATP-binding cassette domain-containing protein, partial [Planctomycetaceae bacterium]
YRGRAALQGISLQLYPGELLGFFGPNGAGKTTMIRCICGLLKPDEGSISLQIPDGFRGSRSSRPGLVPQNLAVYPDTLSSTRRTYASLPSFASRM